MQEEDASAHTFPFELLEHAVSPATAAALDRRGWAVVDGLLGETWCNRLCQEILVSGAVSLGHALSTAVMSFSHLHMQFACVLC